MSKRKSNFEILRILAMFMVLVLHYLDKGNILTSLAEPFDAQSYVAYLLESFAIVAVNVYVLITGYFMCESSMKISRLLQILCQMMWYVLLIPVVLAALGQVDVSGFTTYDWLRLMFPVHMKHYWFVTSYVILMLFVPFLNVAVKHMSKMQHLTCSVLLVVYQTLPKSVVPLVFTDDDAGYGPIWLICLYLIAAYIRKYGIPFFSSAKKSLICYIGGSVVIWASILVMREVYFALDAFGERIDFALHYNHVFCLFTAIALFYTFVHWTPKENKWTAFAGKIGGYTFGVYLLHEHMLVGYNWTKWLGVAPAESVLWTVFTMIWKCALVLAVGILVDWLRSLVFNGIGKMMIHTPVPKLIKKLDQCLREEA